MASKEVDWRPKPGVCGNACPRSPRGPNGPDPCCEVRGRTSSEYDMCKVCLGGYVVYTIPHLYLSQVYKKISEWHQFALGIWGKKNLISRLSLSRLHHKRHSQMKKMTSNLLATFTPLPLPSVDRKLLEFCPFTVKSLFRFFIFEFFCLF